MSENDVARGVKNQKNLIKFYLIENHEEMLHHKQHKTRVWGNHLKDYPFQSLP